MPPSKTVLKAVTPGSVKALIIVEAIVIAFFSFWLANEYVYNVYFRIDVNSVFIEHLTAYTIALGLGIGLAGTAVAAALYKTMQEAKEKIENVAPKIKGVVEKILSNAPVLETRASQVTIANAQATLPATSTAIIEITQPAPIQLSTEEKK